MTTLITFIDVYHGINRFLGTVQGELAKNAFELVLFTLVTYMVASEWTRARDADKDRLQWLIWGFAFLSTTKLLSTIALSYIVFGGLQSALFFAKASVLDNTFEVLAVVMIGIGFLQPVIVSRHPRLLPRRRYIILSFLLAGVIFFFSLSARVSQEAMVVGLYRPAFLEFNLAKLFVSLGVIIYILTHRSAFLSLSRYYPNVVHAMAVYALTPTIHLINFFGYENLSGELLVLSQPFPFFAVLLFTRVIYLQLADKAALYDELALTQEKYEREKELSDLKDEFVSVVSHELKTPLTAISLWGSILGSGRLGKVSVKQKDACKIIKNESMRLAQLINDVLDLSKLEKGKIEVRKRPSDLKALCELSSFSVIAAERDITLRNDVPAAMMVDVDPDRFTQVVYNLVSNALKFTESGGLVRVTARKDSKEVVLTVADSGIGIPPDKMKGLFSKFYQVDNHLTRNTGGTGLGLAITKQIVLLHGGTISVESVVGKGSTFTVRLPLSKK